MNGCLCNLNLQIISCFFALALETGHGDVLMQIVLSSPCLRVDTGENRQDLHMCGQAGRCSKALISPLGIINFKSQLPELPAVTFLF